MVRFDRQTKHGPVPDLVQANIGGENPLHKNHLQINVDYAMLLFTKFCYWHRRLPFDSGFIYVPSGYHHFRQYHRLPSLD